jgi:histone-lysine N-methyltransferase SETMAR
MTEFLEAGKTLNSTRYIVKIKNLRRRVCRARGSTSRILLLHDNARQHTACATIDALETLKFEVLSHSPYSLDLAPSDLNFFPRLKRDLKGTHFASDDEVKQAVTSWIKQRTPEFFIYGMHKLVLHWEKCIERQVDYVEKYVCQIVAKILYFTCYFRLFKYMVSFPRYFNVCITYQTPLVPCNTAVGGSGLTEIQTEGQACNKCRIVLETYSINSLTYNKVYIYSLKSHKTLLHEHAV